MKKLLWLSGVFAVALIAVPGTASAQNWDGQFNWNDILQNFLCSPLVNSCIVPGDDAEDDDDNPQEPNQVGIDELAEFALLEAVLSNSSLPFHNEVRTAFGNIYPIAHSRVVQVQAGIFFGPRAVKTLVGFLVRDPLVGYALASAFDICTGSGCVTDFTAQEKAQILAFLAPMSTGGFSVLTAFGDLDSDGVTNLAEWESTASVTPYSARIAQFIAVATAGAQASVSVSPSNVSVFRGQSAGFTATSLNSSSVPVVETYTWTSSNTQVATVSSSGVATGVGAGTATITARGNTTNASGSAQFTVLTPQWYDLCSLDDAFQLQGSALAVNGEALGLPNDFNQWDIELGSGDGIPDAWQLQLLAFALCQTPAFFGSKTDGVDTTAQQFAANAAAMDDMIADLNEILAFAQAAIPAMTAFATTLGGIAGPASACNNPASLAAVPPLAAAYSGAFGATPINLAMAGTASAAAGSLSDLAPIIEGLPLLSELLTGLVGLSTEMRATITSLIPVSDLNTLLQGLFLFSNVAQFEASCLNSAGEPAAAAAALALSATLTGPTSFALPTFQVYTLGAKAGSGEPFSGNSLLGPGTGGDYNQDGTTNAQIAQYVIDAGGGVNDFIAGATGELTTFWTGNPNLPVAGLVGLTALISALGAAGIATVRRRK